MSDENEVPDSAYEVLDRAAEKLCLKDTSTLTDLERANIDLMLAEIFNALYSQADRIADTQAIPGKIRESRLEKLLPGYQAARTLATYLDGVLP